MLNNLLQYSRHHPSRSVGYGFFALSIVFGSWIARLPEIKQKLHLSEGTLGWCLLAVPLGALVITLLFNTIAGRMGNGPATYRGIVLVCLATPLFSLAFSEWSLFGIFMLMGGAQSFLGISANAAVNTVEKKYRVNIMSTSHAFFSLGAMIGAASSTLVAGLGLPLTWHLLIVSVLIFSGGQFFRRMLLSIAGVPYKATKWSWPPAQIWGLVLIGFCVMMGEGAIADWSAIYLKNDLQSSTFLAGMGFAGFSLTMTLGRFYGDQLRNRLQARNIIAFGSSLGLLGLSLVVLVPSPLVAILGFTIVGIGYSSIVPILFSASANVPSVVPEKGIAVVAGAGTIGIMIGPPVIGMIAEHTSLQSALGFVAFLALVALVLSVRMIK